MVNMTKLGPNLQASTFESCYVFICYINPSIGVFLWCYLLIKGKLTFAH